MKNCCYLLYHKVRGLVLLPLGRFEKVAMYAGSLKEANELIADMLKGDPDLYALKVDHEAFEQLVESMKIEALYVPEREQVFPIRKPSRLH